MVESMNKNVKAEHLYSHSALHGIQTTLKRSGKEHHACHYLVSVHQMALPLIEVANIYVQLTTHLSTPRG